MPISIKKLFLRTLGRLIPSDFFSHHFPVSIKGVCFMENKVILLKNERRNWDLPGGKLKRKEEVVACLEREMLEELNITVQVKDLLDVTQISVMNTVSVFVVIYGCTTQASPGELKISQESFEVGLFTIDELDGLRIRQAYREVIRRAFRTVDLK